MCDPILLGVDKIKSSIKFLNLLHPKYDTIKIYNTYYLYKMYCTIFNIIKFHTIRMKLKHEIVTKMYLYMYC